MSGDGIESWKHKYVATCNSIAQQTKIRVINKTPYTFAVKLKIAGVTYQESTLYASEVEESKTPSSSHTFRPSTGESSNFSVTALPCGYCWYTVTAERIQIGDDVDFENSNRFFRMTCYKMGVYGGNTVAIQETFPGSKVLSINAEAKSKLSDSLKYQTEYRWPQLNNQIEELANGEKTRYYHDSD
mmetsp:Transcript_10648/g.12210  ORF Transcript_10648/g.12210 Transcript_10648/m.12210 type:complete len:186 (+) Transcript_10648:71-628(+)